MVREDNSGFSYRLDINYINNAHHEILIYVLIFFKVDRVRRHKRLFIKKGVKGSL